MAGVYTPQLSDSIDKPCLSCKTILIAKLPLQHIGESRRLKRPIWRPVVLNQVDALDI